MPEPFEDLSASDVAGYMYVAAEDALEFHKEKPDLFIQVCVFTERQLSNFWDQVNHQIYLRKHVDSVQEARKMCEKFSKRISVKYFDLTLYRRTPTYFFPGRIFTSTEPFEDSEPYECP